MAIFLRTSGVSDGTQAQKFVSLPVPVGVQNGDLVLAAIALPQNLTVTPPDPSWTLVAQTDPTLAPTLSVWWKTSIGDLGVSRWVFTLSAATAGVGPVGTVLVYGGADSFAPVEAFAAALTASSGSHAVASVTAGLPGEEAVLFLAAGASGTYTPAANYVGVTNKALASATVEAHHKGLQAPGAQAGFSVGFSAVTPGASVLVVLAPSYGSTSFQDAYQRFFQALPPGIDNVLDFTTTGDFYNLVWDLAAVLKIFVHDLYDLLRTEIIPSRSRYMLPAWESAFALGQTRTATQGTVPQRQAQVQASWRAVSRGSSIADVQAVLAPIFGVSASSEVQVVEADFDRLRLEHTYGWVGDVAVNTSASVQVHVSDGGTVSKMGAQLQLVVDDPTKLASVTLTAPDGTQATWSGPWTAAPIKLYAPALAGAQVLGWWTVSFTSSSSMTVYAGSTLFVEGIGPAFVGAYQVQQDTGFAIGRWGAYVGSHAGENGVPADLAAVRRAIANLAQAHTVGNLIQSLTPYPDTSSGANAAIPDECIPT